MRTLTAPQKIWILLLAVTVCTLLAVPAHVGGHHLGGTLLLTPVLLLLGRTLTGVYRAVWRGDWADPLDARETDRPPGDEPAPAPAEGRIVAVSYRRLQTFGHYENEAVEATMAVAPGQSPDAALHAAQLWVAEKLKQRVVWQEKHDEVERLDANRARLERSIAWLEAKYQKARAFLEKCNIDPDEDLPF